MTTLGHTSVSDGMWMSASISQIPIYTVASARCSGLLANKSARIDLNHSWPTSTTRMKRAALAAQLLHTLHCLVAIASVSHPIPSRTRP